MNVVKLFGVAGVCSLIFLFCVVGSALSVGNEEKHFSTEEIEQTENSSDFLQQEIIDLHTELSIYYYYLGNYFLSEKYLNLALDLESKLKTNSLHLKSSTRR